MHGIVWLLHLSKTDDDGDMEICIRLFLPLSSPAGLVCREKKRRRPSLLSPVEICSARVDITVLSALAEEKSNTSSSEERDTTSSIDGSGTTLSFAGPYSASDAGQRAHSDRSRGSRGSLVGDGGEGLGEDDGEPGGLAVGEDGRRPLGCHWVDLLDLCGCDYVGWGLTTAGFG